jgi:hypothetical protein
MKNEKLEEMLSKLAGETVPDDVRRIAEEQTKQLTDGLLNKPKVALWRTIMKSRITKLAAAAVVIITIGLLAHYYTGSLDGASVAWADVQKQLSIFRPHAFRETVVYNDGSKAVRKFLYRNLTGRREEWPDGRIWIFDFSKVPHDEFLQLDPNQKTAHKTIYKGMNVKQDFDLLSYAQNIQANAAEPLGQRIIEGHKVIGFHHQIPSNDFTIWVDAETRLPVLVELVHPENKITMDMFEYPDDYDASLFSTDIPEGYKAETVIEDHRPIEPKEVSSEDVRAGLNHTAYAIEKLPWMKNICTIEAPDPGGGSKVNWVKVYMTAIQSDDNNLIIVAQGDYYDAARMVWIPKQQIVFESPGGIKLYAHPNGSLYADCFLASFARIKPEFFDIRNLSAERFTNMVVMPNGTILSLSANKQMSDEQLRELVGALGEIKPTPQDK